AGPSGGRGARLPEVFADHDDLAPAQAARMVLQVVLTPPTLLVMTDLRQRRLPDVDEGRTAQMLGADLVVIDHRGPPRRWRRPLAAGRRAARRDVPEARGRD